MIKYVGKCLLIEELGEKILIVGDLHLGEISERKVGGINVSQSLYEKTIDDFYREFIQLYYGNINNIDNNDNYNKPTYIHSITIEGRYKCRWCEKSYKFYNTSFHSHLVKCHNGDYRGDFDDFKTYKLNPETSY